MLAQLLSMLANWLGDHAEETAYNVVKSRTVRGVERAIQELTGDTLTAAGWFRQGRIEPGHMERMEAPQTTPATLTGAEPSPAMPTFTRTQIHALKRDELIELAQARGWRIDADANVKDIRAAVLEALEL